MKVFHVSMMYRTTANKLVRFVGEVVSVPGVDIFATARAVAPSRTRKGQVGRVIRATAVAA